MEIVFVVTGEDKPIGRHQTMTANPIKTVALEKDIPCLQPARIRGNTEFFDTLRSYETDYFIVVAYGKIVPQELLDIPKKYPINIHGSILPKYRGASPIQAALIAWEKETWVTIMVMDDKMDEGDMIEVKKIPIDTHETTETLFAKFAKVSGIFAIETIRKLDSWILIPKPQDENQATYCKKITKEEGLLEFGKSAQELYHLFQGLTPWPGIYTSYKGKKLIIEDCFYKEVENNEWAIGEVIKKDSSVAIVCGKWLLTLSQVKLEWKKSQSIKEFLNGQQDFIGSILPS